MDACGRFFGEAADVVEQLGELVVDHRGEVAAVVENQVERLAGGEEQRLLDAPIELLVVHALPGVNGDAGLGDRAGGVILRREDVAAAPGDFGAELAERFDQHGGLDRHVQAAGDASARERLGAAVLFAECHQAGHFVLGQVDFLAAPFGQAVELGGRTIEHLVRQFRSHLRHGNLLFTKSSFLRTFYCKWRERDAGKAWQLLSKVAQEMHENKHRRCIYGIQNVRWTAAGQARPAASSTNRVISSTIFRPGLPIRRRWRHRRRRGVRRRSLGATLAGVSPPARMSG